MRTLITATLICVSSSALALGPGQAERGFLDGANHRLGDLSFFARFGRAPTEADGEKLRMRTHLEFVRAWLAARPATRPDLEGRRAELLGYLDDYITRDITPHNNDLTYRNPVFVDDLGRICAVGYLIERSGRQDIVADVVATHRYSLLDNIDLPELQTWVAESGFTLDELASIQPGYMEPAIEGWSTWYIDGYRPADGRWTATLDGVTTTGTWKAGKMEGAWTRTDVAGRVVGRGDFKAGRGAWTSYGPNGKVLAEGPFVGNHPDGKWTLYHGSGNVAATGAFDDGLRDGAWTFFYDTAERTPIASGRFNDMRVVGTWKHFGPDGALIGTTSSSRRGPYGEELHTMRGTRDASGTTITSTTGNVGGDGQRTWAISQGKTRLYLHGWEDTMHDAEGYTLTRRDAGDWVKSGCRWSPATRRAAARGDTLAVARLLLDERPDYGVEAPVYGPCVTDAPVASELAADYGRLAARLTTPVTPTPEFARALIVEPACDDCEPNTAPADMAAVVGGNMGWYIEWPHIDGLFARVFETLADHFSPGSVPELVPDGEPDTALGLVFN